MSYAFKFSSHDDNGLLFPFTSTLRAGSCHGGGSVGAGVWSFHNLRWQQGRRHGCSLVSVSVFIVYYMYIYLISRWLALITNKSYCFLYWLYIKISYLIYLILFLKSRSKLYLIAHFRLSVIKSRDASWRTPTSHTDPRNIVDLRWYSWLS